MTYHQFQNVVANMEAPPEPEETVTSRMLGGTHTPLSDDHDAKYGVPTLEELGAFELEHFYCHLDLKSFILLIHSFL